MRPAAPRSVDRIVLLTAFPFSERDYHRFGVDVIKQRFDVAVLDCTPLLRPDLWEKYAHRVFLCAEYIAVSDWSTLFKEIALSRATLAIDYLAGCSGSQRIRAHLRINGVLRTIVDNGPIPSARATRRVTIRQIITRAVPFIVNRIRSVLSRIRRPDVPPDIALLSGTAGLASRGASGASHKIWGHSFDYDIFLQKKRLGNTSEEHAVFLDEDMIYHSDYDHLRIDAPTTEAAYYGSMRRFFSEIESASQVPVIIAAHPRSNYQLRPHLWEDYQVVSGQTAELVRDAKVVICHQSTSVSFAVLWRKSVVALTTNDLNKSWLGDGIALMSKTLDVPLINVDDVRSAPSITTQWTVSETAYSRYQSTFIKRPGSPDIPLWEIFCNYVEENFLVTRNKSKDIG